MTSSYRTPAAHTFPLQYGCDVPQFGYRVEQVPATSAPIIVRKGGVPIALKAIFGLLPNWARSESFAKKSYNAALEEIPASATFRGPWNRRQLCLIPAVAFYMSQCDGDLCVRQLIRRVDHQAFALAGLWDTSRSRSGTRQISFSMLTIPADDDPLMQRFGLPGKAQRAVVPIASNDYAQWLGARREDEIRSLLKPFDPNDYLAQPERPEQMEQRRSHASLDEPPLTNPAIEPATPI